MATKWFVTGAIAGSGFEELADIVLKSDDLTDEQLKDVDLLFVKDKSSFLQNKRIGRPVIISDKAIPVSSQEKHILFSTGENFMSRLGHDIVNLFTPFNHFEYLDSDIISDRVDQGLRFGRQINTIGHLLQKDGRQNGRYCSFDEFVLNFQTLCKKNSIDFNILKTGADRIDTIPDTAIMNPVIEEVISNWFLHGNGKFEFEIVNGKEAVFRNSFQGLFNFERPKAQLRCPFVKRTNSPGAGLGLFIVSLSSVAGGFDWDISVKENCFSLSLHF